MPTEMELTLEQTQQGVSYEVSVLSDIEDSHGPSDAMHKPLPATQTGNPVKEILLKLNLPYHRSILTNSKVTPTTLGRMTKPYSSPDFIANFESRIRKECVKNFKKDATLKLFKSTNQERYEHVGPEVTRSQDDKVTRWQNGDYHVLMISQCSRSHLHLQVKIKEQARA
ncbi:hypothetical protein Tco_0658168 [Tanacetum coccineum]